MVSALLMMKPVVESMGVELYCPVDGMYAFFNSPFPAHKANTGVDIYPSEVFGDVAPSPVNGEVELIRRVKAPIGHGFVAADHDTVLLIRNKDNPDTVTKILHIDPMVEIGTEVQVGDPIGATLRSGYYGWSTSPHMHIEVRSPKDPIRARGGYNLNTVDLSIIEPVEEISGEVVHLQPEFAYIKLDTLGSGLVGTVNGEPAILDGGIPYYGWMGAHIEDAPESGTIELLGVPIADITERFHHSCKGTSREYQFTVKDKPILGLSLTLMLSDQPLVKLIPVEKNGLDMKMDERVKVELMGA